MNKQWLWVVAPIGIGVLLLLLLLLASEAPTTSRGGVKITDVKEGTGKAVDAGDVAVVHYTGSLKNGTKFDSSFDHPGKKPFEFRIGAGDVIKGWDKGVAGMKVGGVRKLVIPSELGYGERGSPPKIPPHSELHFEIELLAIK
jgi:FKBP-type peptidyl-prolyl cis-trans isomerase